MKTLSVCLLLCVVTTLTRAAAVPEAAAENDEVVESHLVKRAACSRGWTEFRGHCFRYVPQRMTWAKAEKNCQALGGNLASVHDIAEYHELQRLILTTSHEYKQAWIGGSDAQEEGTFLWSDGSYFYYSNWCPGQPDNGRDKNQHCIQMSFGDSKCWDDIKCSDNRPSVCAKTM